MFIIDSEPLNGYMLNWNHTNWFISLIIMVVFDIGFICSHSTCPHTLRKSRTTYRANLIHFHRLSLLLTFRQVFFRLFHCIALQFQVIFFACVYLWNVQLKSSIFLSLYIMPIQIECTLWPVNDLTAFTFIYSTTIDPTASSGLKILWGIIMQRFPQYDWFRHLQNYLINF